MGRAPCCDKANVKKGPWSPEEDAKLKSYIDQNGTGGNWIALPQKIGLKRCGKSCRLRWLNYLRPNIKHGGFSDEEDRIICSLYGSIGSRWSIIAAQLPGRTDNDIKNYWNTRLKKKLLGKQSNSSSASGRRSKRSIITDTDSILPSSVSDSEAMFAYTSWPPGFDQSVYYDGSMVDPSNPLLIPNDHQEIDTDQLVNMMMNTPNELEAINSFPRELEELMMSSTSNDQAAQRMDHLLGWDRDQFWSTSCGESMGSWCEMSSLISLPMGGADGSSCAEGIPPQDGVFDHQLIRYTAGN